MVSYQPFYSPGAKKNINVMGWSRQGFCEPMWTAGPQRTAERVRRRVCVLRFGRRRRGRSRTAPVHSVVIDCKITGTRLETIYLVRDRDEKIRWNESMHVWCLGLSWTVCRQDTCMLLVAPEFDSNDLSISSEHEWPSIQSYATRIRRSFSRHACVQPIKTDPFLRTA
jgi:hypothetical protein